MDWLGLVVGAAGMTAGVLVLLFRRRVGRFFGDVLGNVSETMADVAQGPVLVIWAAALVVMGAAFVLSSV